METGAEKEFKFLAFQCVFLIIVVQLKESKGEFLQKSRVTEALVGTTRNCEF